MEKLDAAKQSKLMLGAIHAYDMEFGAFALMHAVSRLSVKTASRIAILIMQTQQFKATMAI